MPKFVKDWIIPILVAFTLVLISRVFFVTVNVDGPSMVPNLADNQKVLALKHAKISRGSVIVFDARKEDPGIRQGQKYYVKRVIAVEGDTVRSENGNLYVNDKLVNQDWISEEQRTQGTRNWDFAVLQSNNSPFTSYNTETKKEVSWADGNQTKVPKDNYFVLGDNREVSEDSRYFGWVNRDHILGVVYSLPWSDKNDNINNAWENFFEKS